MQPVAEGEQVGGQGAEDADELAELAVGCGGEGASDDGLLVDVEAGPGGVDDFHWSSPEQRMCRWLGRPGLEILTCVLPGRGQVPQRAVPTGRSGQTETQARSTTVPRPRSAPGAGSIPQGAPIFIARCAPLYEWRMGN